MNRIAICDDEIHFASSLKLMILNYCTENYIDTVIDTFENPQDLINLISKDPNMYTLIFMDILMDPVDGLEATRQLRNLNCNTDLVFITASPDFAIDGYSVNACAYILKPLVNEQVVQILKKHFLTNEHFLVMGSSHKSFYRIDINTIEYVESALRIVHIHCDHNLVKSFYSKLSGLHSKLPQDIFVHCHKSFLVNLNKIMSIEETTIILKSGAQIPCSRRNKKEVIRRFLDINA